MDFPSYWCFSKPGTPQITTEMVNLNCKPAGFLGSLILHHCTFEKPLVSSILKIFFAIHMEKGKNTSMGSLVFF